MIPSIPGQSLLDPTVLDNPYPFYRRLQSEAPVWQVPGTQIFVISRYSLLDEASRRVEDFSSNLRGVLYRGRKGMPARLTRSSGIPQILATADPPLHGVHRKAVFPELVAKRMSAMAPDVEQVAEACISQLITEGSADFMAVLGNPLPMTVVSRLVGFKGSDIDQLLEAAFDSTAVVSASLSLFQLLKTIFRSAVIQRWLGAQLQAASTGGDDILSAIKRNVESKTLREFEGRAILHILLAAGGESTSSLLGNAVRMLAEDQQLQQRLRERPELLPSFIEEVLRLESPFRFHLRSTSKDVAIGGLTIPSGATVLMFWGAGNRDPEVFAKPDEIDLSRPRVHMTFGRGIHTCVGAPLARLEGLLVLRMLLERTRQITLTPGRTPKWVPSMQVRRHEQLFVTVKA